MNKKHIVILVHIQNRTKNVKNIQEILSEYGCYIKTRLGLHETNENFCSPDGLIVLEMLDNEKIASELENNLNKITGIEVVKVIFNHTN